MERVIHEDAFECAFRAGMYKFGRLSNRRILELLHATARNASIELDAEDSILLDRWFSVYSLYFHELKSRQHSALRRAG
ncbi:MAG TPA: hypothetical protein VMD07_03710 [Candidatus Acidoferrales bacterium]|nr:hypothetical protein [Candidatus Acidoferrales bacterium]